MTNQQHLIVPDPELLQEWYDDKTDYFTDMIRAAQWGRDQELEACCEWVAEESPVAATELRAARRSKPPSLKEQALCRLDYVTAFNDDKDIIRRALESIHD